MFDSLLVSVCKGRAPQKYGGRPACVMFRSLALWGESGPGEVFVWMKWITTVEAARILGLNPGTLRRYETPDGRWCYLYGERLRVWRTYKGVQLHRQYSLQEVQRLAWRLQNEP